MLGGVRSIKGEKQMIYKNIKPAKIIDFTKYIDTNRSTNH